MSQNVPFEINLDAHEIERNALTSAHIHATSGQSEQDIWADEAKAWEMLYSGLDDKQQEIYDMLVEQGVIPEQR
jgi:hypothetical protein